MKKAKPKSVHFSALVKTCGQPEPVTLWTRPAADKHFMAAVRQNRILTVEQQNVGTKKDVGLIGFIKKQNVSYFIFPKPLNAFKGMAVNGINYDLVKQPKRGAQKVKEDENGWEFKEERPATKRTPRFRISLRWTAVLDTTVEIEAPNAKAARKEALDSGGDPPDFSGAEKKCKILRVEKL